MVTPHLLLDKYESVRGSQYAAQAYRTLLCEHGLVGSMARRENPYDNAMMESFMMTLRVEASGSRYLSPKRFEQEQSRKPVKSAA